MNRASGIFLFFVILFSSFLLPGLSNGTVETRTHESLSIHRGSDVKAPQHGRSRFFDLKHIALDMTLDLERQSIEGISSLRFEPIQPQQKRIALDSAELKIEKVFVDGREVSFSVLPEKIDILFNEPKDPGKDFDIKIHYSGFPRRGMYFYKPTNELPSAPFQVWTQSEAESARYWFPTYDFPNDKATTETIVRVDPKFTVISNGELTKTETVKGKKAFYYKQKIPHVTYLITVVAGQFDQKTEKHNGIPLEYYVPKGEKHRIKPVFKNTGGYLDFFESVTGLKYPFEKYAQVVVFDFIAGGMENTSATTLNEYVLYPDSEKEEWKLHAETLISHEVAHQWFGNLVTCETWNHIWLNEGFATYFSIESLESVFSREEVEFAMDQEAREILTSSALRPTVDYSFDSPDSVFDVNVYARGAWILRMLKARMGDDLFRKGIRTYFQRFNQKTVDTADLRRVLENESGLDLSRFFRDWVYAPGFLEIKGNWSWNPHTSSVGIELEQKPIRGKSKEYYSNEIIIEIETDQGRIREKLLLDRRKQTFIFPLLPETAQVKTVRLDPDQLLLAKIDFKRSKDEWISDAQKDSRMLVRLQAVRNLAKNSDRLSIDALTEVLRKDPFWGVRKEAALVLGKMMKTEAWDRILSLLPQEKSIRVRTEMVQSLKNDTRKSTLDRLIQQARKDSSPWVRKNAAYILAVRRTDRAFGTTQEVATQPSHRFATTRHVLDGFAESGWEKGLSLTKKLASPKQPLRIREKAIETLGQIGKYQKDRRDLFDFLLPAIRSNYRDIQAAGYQALGALGLEEAREILENAAETEVEYDIRHAAQLGLDALNRGIFTPPLLRGFKKELQEVKTENRRMEERLKTLEKWVDEFKKEPESSDSKEAAE